MDSKFLSSLYQIQYIHNFDISTWDCDTCYNNFQNVGFKMALKNRWGMNNRPKIWHCLYYMFFFIRRCSALCIKGLRIMRKKSQDSLGWKPNLYWARWWLALKQWQEKWELNNNTSPSQYGYLGTYFTFQYTAWSIFIKHVK